MLLTIFTPTYNRAHLLERCFNSLSSTKGLSFEWVIIDDGSTDNTQDVVLDIKNRSSFSINYIYQENSGKQAAWNLALSVAKGEFFIGLDSDDAFSHDAFNIIKSDISKLVQVDLVGIRYQAVRYETNSLDSKFIPLDFISYWSEEYLSKNHGERIDLLKTNIIRKFLYPVDNSIKFIPEVYFYSLLTKNNYKFFYSSDAVRVFYNDQSPESRLSVHKIKTNADGYIIAYDMLLSSISLFKWIRNPIRFVKVAIRLNQAIILSKTSKSNSLTSRVSRVISFPAITYQSVRWK